MSPSSSTGLKAEAFSAHTEQRGSTVVVWMKGNADMAVHEHLKKFLDDLDVGAKAAQTKEAIFEFEDLYFMNSTCLSLLLRFINLVVSAPPSNQYKLRFRSNSKLRWQKKSLAALHAYAEDLVVVE